MTMTIEVKRRAVFTVLQETLQGDGLWRAMWRWQNHYAQKSQFELNGFLSDCKDIPEVAQNRSHLYRQLIGILMDSSAQLQPDPMNDMLKYQSAQAESGSLDEMELFQQPDWSDVYSSVLTTLFGQLRSDTVRVVKRYAMEQSLRHNISQELAYAFNLWGDGKHALVVASAPLSDLKRLLNFIYIGVCECLGPVDADRILSLSIRTANEINQNPATDPRQLLEK